MSTSTPVKFNELEQQEIEEQQMTPGRLVRYETANVSRTGRILKVLSTADETPRPPKILYEVYDEKKKKTKQYTNNPSTLRVVDGEEEGEEEEAREEEEEEEGAEEGGEGQEGGY